LSRVTIVKGMIHHRSLVAWTVFAPNACGLIAVRWKGQRGDEVVGWRRHRLIMTHVLRWKA